MVTLAQRRSGRSRVIQVTPNPAGAVWSRLFGVSCTSAHACVAVGYYYDATFRLRPLAERWNGRNWAIRATPSPAGALATGLFAVSCTSPGTCTTVGEYVTSSGEPRAMAERWNGRNWAIQAAARPAGALASGLFGVSCTAPRACTAVGAYAASSRKTLTLAEAWNGTRWRVQATPKPPGAFISVSCSSPRACTAVGSYSPNSDGATRSMAQRWNGTRWTIQAAPDPPGALSSELLAVSCSSPRACTAVGDNVDRNADTVTLALAWNGTRWRVHATPATPKPASIFSNVLTGVSCTSLRACTAVGSYLAFYTVAFRSVVLRWNGARWVSQATPDDVGAAISGLAAVSCAAPDACTAVGSFDKTATRATSLAETWNGTRWRIKPVPSPAGATATSLSAVSCTRPRACTATGSYHTRSGKVLAFAATWNGARWQVRSARSPLGADGTYLDAVSCTSPRACTATGVYYISSGRGRALAERWNGTTWRIQPTPAPAPASVQVLLGAVSCTSARACVTVGTYIDASGQTHPLVEAWNGARWRIQAVPIPPGANDVELDSVSCTSPRACTATGTLSRTNLTNSTLAYRWDGKTWRVQPTSNPAGVATSTDSSVSLNAVSCASATACTAIGDYAPNGQPTAFAETWNGTRWSLQATAIPAGAIASELTGVSCDARRCTAVGDYGTLSGAELTLAIHRTEDPP
jgi:hypothetical protein